MIILNPTGGVTRNDSYGQGFFGAPRGAGDHRGTDFTLPQGPGQAVLAPITGRFDRIAYPYPDDTETMGGVFSNRDITIKMFYFKPDESLLRCKVTMGQVVGVAQDISLLYPGMTPHIHLQVGDEGEINPLLLM